MSPWAHGEKDNIAYARMVDVGMPMRIRDALALIRYLHRPLAREGLDYMKREIGEKQPTPLLLECCEWHA